MRQINKNTINPTNPQTQNRLMVCSVKPFFSISIFMNQKIEMFSIHKIECSESADQKSIPKCRPRSPRNPLASVFMLFLKMVNCAVFCIIVTRKHAQRFWKNTQSNWKKNDETALNALG